MTVEKTDKQLLGKQRIKEILGDKAETILNHLRKFHQTLLNMLLNMLMLISMRAPVFLINIEN